MSILPRASCPRNRMVVALLYRCLVPQLSPVVPQLPLVMAAGLEPAQWHRAHPNGAPGLVRGNIEGMEHPDW